MLAGVRSLTSGSKYRPRTTGATFVTTNCPILFAESNYWITTVPMISGTFREDA